MDEGRVLFSFCRQCGTQPHRGRDLNLPRSRARQQTLSACAPRGVCCDHPTEDRDGITLPTSLTSPTPTEQSPRQHDACPPPMDARQAAPLWASRAASAFTLSQHCPSFSGLNRNTEHVFISLNEGKALTVSAPIHD